MSNSSVILRASTLSLTLALLAAIAICSLAPSAYMTEIPFIPTWLGEWADRNGNFRNFPVFAALAALLFFVLSLSPLKHWSSEPSLRDSVRQSRGQIPNHFPLRIAVGAFAATALLGALLEVAQLLLPNRHADPMDLLWMTLGAFVGAFAPAYIFKLLAPSLPATSNP